MKRWRRPRPERLEQARETLGAAFPAEDVALYLSTLMWRTPRRGRRPEGSREPRRRLSTT